MKHLALVSAMIVKADVSATTGFTPNNMQWSEHRLHDGDYIIATFTCGRLTARVQDCCDDYSIWQITENNEVIDCGDVYEGDDHFAVAKNQCAMALMMAAKQIGMWTGE